MFFVELPVQREAVIWPNDYENAYEEWILAEARSIAQKRLERIALGNLPSEVSALLIDRLASYETEVFGCLFMDTQLRVQSFEIMFRGTISACTVHPREVVKRALQLNTAALIFAHNHPVFRHHPMQTRRSLSAFVVPCDLWMFGCWIISLWPALVL